MYLPPALLALPLALAPLAAPAAPAATAAGPGYTCDEILASRPAVYGDSNCVAEGGAPQSGFITTTGRYHLNERKGEKKSFTCIGGNADAPTSIAPKRCDWPHARTWPGYGKYH